MANLSITATDVAPVRVVERHEGVAGVAVTAGQVVRLDTSSGKYVLANATTSANVGNRPGVALNNADANGALTVLFKGEIDLGDALSALAYDAQVFLSDTDGAMADTAGTVSKVLGTVTPRWASVTADKVLRVDL